MTGIKMTDREIIARLVDKDEAVTRDFFFNRCRPLFISIIRKVFSYRVEFDEFVNEFYLYLMEDDAYKLKQFQYRSSIYQWLKVVAIRYFVKKRDSMIENSSQETLLNNIADTESTNEETAVANRIDESRLLNSMSNKRFAHVLKRLVIEQREPKQVAEELNITVDNLYNIKKRAISSLTKMVLNEIGSNGK
ncbi:MAG: sigma-70 family RNA polymerase sigma factor [Bacteroidales bacterium]|nr:sigma-70 family RNA polymerase sigma factor [Bacteroidales bacterium]